MLPIEKSIKEGSTDHDEKENSHNEKENPIADLESESKECSEQATNETSKEPDSDKTKADAPPALSKRAKKKLLKRQAWLDGKKERKELEKAKRKAKLHKRKLEDPNLPSYSESRKKIKNTYAEKVKSPINIGMEIEI